MSRRLAIINNKYYVIPNGPWWLAVTSSTSTRPRPQVLFIQASLPTSPNLYFDPLASVIDCGTMSAGPSSSEAGTSHNIIDAAEEFVDKMNPTEDEVAEGEEEEGQDATENGDQAMDERKKKLEQLRKRMVCIAWV